jgi:porphobilinogen synthase
MSNVVNFEDTLIRRPRRNRKSDAVRDLVQETYLLPHQLVAPLFIVEGKEEMQSIESLPGVFRKSLDFTLKEVQELYILGIRSVDLFAYVNAEKKNPLGSEAIREGNLIQTTVDAIKQKIPEMCVMVDIALDPYTDHGHDGVINEKGQVDNDRSLEILGNMALLCANAGADIVAPSDMMDGRVGYIRNRLDQEGLYDVGICSYAAKYTSALYRPFRDALGSAPRFGDKKGYQLNPANVREALRECALDEEEGADMLLIKPATLYLDVIAKLRSRTHLPIGAYHVSGEYAMLMAAAKLGWMDADKLLMESLISIRRAGADFILTYGASRAAQLLQSP